MFAVFSKPQKQPKICLPTRNMVNAVHLKDVACLNGILFVVKNRCFNKFLSFVNPLSSFANETCGKKIK